MESEKQTFAAYAKEDLAKNIKKKLTDRMNESKKERKVSVEAIMDDIKGIKEII